MRLGASLAAAALLAAGLASPAAADIYRWTDAEGRTHFTQNLGQVPAAHRAQAERSARKEAQRSSSAPAALARVGSAPRVRGGRPIEIPFEKAGNAMLVYVRINDAVTAPFLVDTGASDVVVPSHVASAAGVRVTRDTPRQSYQTANGMVDSPVVTLESVQVGGARVENVRGSLSDSMSVGLLGGTFFNHFTMQIDPGTSVITLVQNQNVAGGANQAEWRGRFRELRAAIAAIDAHTAGGELLNEEREEELRGRRAELAAELEALEHAANAAGVPQAWRD